MQAVLPDPARAGGCITLVSRNFLSYQRALYKAMIPTFLEKNKPWMGLARGTDTSSARSPSKTNRKRSILTRCDLQQKYATHQGPARAARPRAPGRRFPLPRLSDLTINIDPFRHGKEMFDVLLHDPKLGVQVLLSRWAAEAFFDLLAQSRRYSLLLVEPGARLLPRQGRRGADS